MPESAEPIGPWYASLEHLRSISRPLSPDILARDFFVFTDGDAEVELDIPLNHVLEWDTVEHIQELTTKSVRLALGLQENDFQRAEFDPHNNTLVVRKYGMLSDVEAIFLLGVQKATTAHSIETYSKEFRILAKAAAKEKAESEVPEAGQDDVETTPPETIPPLVIEAASAFDLFKRGDDYGQVQDLTYRFTEFTDWFKKLRDSIGVVDKISFTDFRRKTQSRLDSLVQTLDTMNYQLRRSRIGLRETSPSNCEYVVMVLSDKQDEAPTILDNPEEQLRKVSPKQADNIRLLFRVKPYMRDVWDTDDTGF